ncbi:hypothetical protein [Streptosporangium canum]|uniref:hypothetical protein n=1 Tax=Streptosporangium canum TaxID=324952 RepID=UPI0037B94BC0
MAAAKEEMVAALLARLGGAEEAARQQCAELSRQLEELQERLTAAQRRMKRLSIAREELAALAADPRPDPVSRDAPLFPLVSLPIGHATGTAVLSVKRSPALRRASPHGYGLP